MKDIGKIRKKECGARLKALRQKHGLTQEELAKAIHTSTSNLAKIEIGASNPSIDLLYEIRNFFSIPIDYLLFGASNSPEKLLTALENTLDSIAILEVEIRNLNTVECYFPNNSQPFSEL